MLPLCPPPPHRHRRRHPQRFGTHLRRSLQSPHGGEPGPVLLPQVLDQEEHQAAGQDPLGHHPPLVGTAGIRAVPDCHVA